MGRNAKDSTWRSTPRALRTRKGLEVMLPAAVRARLEAINEATGKHGLSATVERLVREATAPGVPPLEVFEAAAAKAEAEAADRSKSR